MTRPRQYLSFSQMTLIERDPELYAKEYLYGEKKRISRNMHLGSQMAEGLEQGEASGDPLLDAMMAKLPKLDRADLPVESKKGVLVDFNRNGHTIKIRVPVLKDPKGDIPILAVPDTATKDYSAFKEYKSSTRSWTQKMVDESGQVTFYATAIWLATGHIPTDIELVCVPTEYDADGRLSPTGELVRLPTSRSLSDVIKMTRRMRDAWRDIEALCKKELL